MNKQLMGMVLREMRVQKKRGVLIVTVLSLSFACLMLSLCLVGSIHATIEESCMDIYGIWKVADLSSTEEEKTSYEENPLISEIGTVQIVGTIVDDIGNALTKLGSIDKEYYDISSVELEAGVWPSNEQEIVLEADVLSALGYNQELGQEIIIKYVTEAGDYSEVIYHLSGVISEYTDIWEATEWGLAGAVIQATDSSVVENIQYFLASDETISDVMLSIESKDSVVSNILAYDISAREIDYQIYTAIILLITIVGVMICYILEINLERKSLILFRIIGGTKKQLMCVMLVKTFVYTIVSMVVGGILGCLLTYVMVDRILPVIFYVYRFEVPILLVIAFALVWNVCIYATKIIIMCFAYRDKIYGKIGRYIGEKQILFQKFTICILACVAMVSAIGAYTKWIENLTVEETEALMFQIICSLCTWLICTSIISALMILSAYTDRRKYAILCAIGMTRRQFYLEKLKNSIFWGVGCFIPTLYFILSILKLQINILQAFIVMIVAILPAVVCYTFTRLIIVNGNIVSRIYHGRI